MTTKSYVDIHGRNKTGRAFKQVEGSLTRMGSLAGKAAGALGLVGGVSLGFLVRDTIKSAASMEKLAASMKTVTGSSANAAAALKPIKEFAKTTPFDLQQAVQGFVKLKALGLDPSIDSLRSYGNTASAMGKELNQMIEAVADAATGEFERLKEFGIKAKSQGDQVTFTFQGVATTIGKNAAEIEGYLKGIGNNAFGSAMADQMDTIGGASSNLKDSLFELQVRFSETSGLSDALKSGMLKVSEAFSTATQYLSENKDKVQEIIGIIPIATKTLILFGATFLALKTGTAVVIAMSGAMSLMGASVTALGIKSAAAAGGVTILKGAMALLGGPVGVIALAVTALGFYIFKAQRAAEASVQFSRSINEMSATGSQFEFDRIDKELSGLNEEFKKAKSKLDDFNASGFRHINMQAALESKLADVKKRIIEAQNAHKKVTAAAEKNRKEAERLEKIQTDLNNSFKTTNVVVPQTGRNLTNLTGDVKDLITRTKELFGVYGKFESAADEVDRILVDNAKSASRLEGIQDDLNRRFNDGEISAKAYRAALEDAGGETEKLGTKSQTVAELMTQGWKKFQDGVQDAFFNAFRSGENFFDSLKNIAFDILAQIAAKIATTFVINNLLGGGTGGVFGQALTAVVGGGNSGGGGGGDVIGQAAGQAARSALEGTAVGNGLGIGSGAGTIVGNGINTLFGGTTGSTVVGNAINSLAASVGIGTTAVAAANAATLAQTAAIANTFSSAATFAAGAESALVLGQAAPAATQGVSALASIGPAGWAALAALAAVAVLSGNSRSPQQIGLDQLGEVDAATKAGRNTQVENLRGSGVSFLGGYNEASTFFGAAGISDSDLDKVGEILKQRYGFDQAFGLKDGILRLVDEDRKFSVNHEQITTEVLASIAEVTTAFTQGEKTKLQALGGTFLAMDRLYDQNAKAGMSAAEAVTSAYSSAFGVTELQAVQALENIGISSERMAEIMGSASNEVLTQLTGISESANQSARLVGEGFRESARGIIINFDGLRRNLEREINVKVNTQTNQQAPSRAEQQNTNNLQTLTNIAIGNSIQNQPLFGT